MFIDCSLYLIDVQINAFVVRNSYVFSRKSTLQLIPVAANYKQLGIKKSGHLELKMASADDYYKGMDAYQILEVPRSADKKGVKSAYRKGEDPTLHYPPLCSGIIIDRLIGLRCELQSEEGN